MKSSTAKDRSDEVEQVLQALTTASGVEAEHEVHVLEVNQDTGFVRFIVDRAIVKPLASALNFSGELVKTIYRALPSLTGSSRITESVPEDSEDDTDPQPSTQTIALDLSYEVDGEDVDNSAISETSNSSFSSDRSIDQLPKIVVLDLPDEIEDQDVGDSASSIQDPLAEYVSKLNVAALTQEAQEGGSLVADSVLGKVFTPNAMKEFGIDGMQLVDNSHGVYTTSHTAQSSRGAKLVQTTSELAGQVLTHSETVASIVRGTREPINSAHEADALGDTDIEPLDGNVFNVSTTGKTVTTTFNLFAFLQLLSLHCTSALTVPIISQAIGREEESYIIHLETLKRYVGSELAELIFNPVVGGESDQIELTPIMLPQTSPDKAVDAITPKSLFSIAIDTSGSMSEPNLLYSRESKLDVAKEKLKMTIAKLTSSTPNWTIVLTKFDSETTILGEFDSEKSALADIYSVINQLYTSGQTRLYGTAKDQFEQVISLASSKQYSHFATVLFTDGAENASKIDHQTVVKTAGSAVDAVGNLQIFTLELGNSNHEFFTQMAKVSGCTYIPLNTMSDLSGFDNYINLLNKNTSVVKFLTEAFEVFSRIVAAEGEITIGNTTIKPDVRFEVNGVLHYIAEPETTLAKIHDGIFLTEPDQEYVVIGDSGKQEEEAPF